MNNLGFDYRDVKDGNYFPEEEVSYLDNESYFFDQANCDISIRSHSTTETYNNEKILQKIPILSALEYKTFLESSKFAEIKNGDIIWHISCCKRFKENHIQEIETFDLSERKNMRVAVYFDSLDEEEVDAICITPLDVIVVSKNASELTIKLDLNLPYDESVYIFDIVFEDR